MVAAVKLPVLNPNEFKLWKMRIEQYFLMTDYALWEVILNGDSPPPTRTVDGIEKTYPPITVEEKLASKNELKARGTLLLGIINFVIVSIPSGRTFIVPAGSKECKVKVIRILAGQIIRFAAMVGWPFSLPADSYLRVISKVYGVEVIRILAGQVIRFAAMAVNPSLYVYCSFKQCHHIGTIERHIADALGPGGSYGGTMFYVNPCGLQWQIIGSLEDSPSIKVSKIQLTLDAYTCSTSTIVEPLEEPKRTLNRKLHQNKKVPFKRREEGPENPREASPPILDITHFPLFLNYLEFHDPMANPDDEPMWAADHVVVPTPAFADEDNSNSDTDKMMARMDAMTTKMDAQYKEMKSRTDSNHCGGNHSNADYNDDDTPILTDNQSARPSGSLPSNTQPNHRGNSSKPYQPPQARNEHVNAIYTRSGRSYDPPTNPNNSYNQNDSQHPIDFNSDDADEEPTPQPQTPKPKEKSPTPKPYKPRTLYPQRLRKEKMEAQYEKFLDMIHTVQINVPLIDVLAGMRNYDKFLKELVSNKHKLEKISSAFLSDESSAIIQNKVPPKLRDPGSFLIPCTFTENMLVKVGKFTFYVNFVILEMEEDSKVPLILVRPFLHTANAVIHVKQKQLNLRVGSIRMVFSIDSAMKDSYLNDDTCFSNDVIDEIVEEDSDALLNQGSKILYSIKGTPLEDKFFNEFDEFIAMNIKENTEPR
ncbi:hypothetical protein Tco_0946391 [Tanacetum coccineum]